MEFRESEPGMLPEEEKREKLSDVAIVLGSSFRRDKPQVLSLEAKIRALAAGALAESGAVNKLIFTGGKTRQGQPSEAQAMKEYMLSKYPNLSEELMEIITEDDSLHTRENAKLTAEKLKQTNQTSAIVLSNSFHLKRAEAEFAAFGIEAQGLSAEDLVVERSSAHQKLIDRYLKSARMKRLKAVEVILTGLQKVDPDGTLISKLAKTFRDNNIII